jgi:hypothetical protein
MLLDKAETDLLKTYVYTSKSEAELELAKRWNDTELRNRVEQKLGTFMLKQLISAPRAVFSRSIISPNLEFNYFIDLVSDMQIEPLLLEYDGKFVAKNEEKYHLCKMYFLDHVGKRKTPVLSSFKIVDFNTNEGKNMSEIKTLNGQPLRDFHHGLLEQQYPGKSVSILDITNWFNSTRFLTEDYYFYYFSLFVCHGILFENFLTEDKEEVSYIKSHVFKSFIKVHEYFGVKPLIFPLLPIENEKFRTWYSYSNDIKKSFPGDSLK